MKKYLFLSYGFEKPTPEIMGAWEKWFESISDRMVDQGGLWNGGREIIMVRKTPEKLTLVGWGPRRPRTPLAPPGEVRGMRAMEQGDTWITLDWRAPVDGGAPAAYRIQRRTGKGRSWDDAGTVVETEHRMTDQPRGVELSYRVVAINRAGTGRPSAVATAVL